MAEWFTKLAKDAMELADGITDSIAEQAKSAQADILKEQEKMKAEVEAQKKVMTPSSLLPWETEDESRAILSQDLMEQILAISLNEKNFTVAPPGVGKLEFDFQAFVPTIMRLLQLDTNLAKAHAKLSPKMNEESFWRNYNYRVQYLRAKIGIVDNHNVSVEELLRDDIIFKPDIETDTEISFESTSPKSGQSPKAANEGSTSGVGLSLLGLTGGLTGGLTESLTESFSGFTSKSTTSTAPIPADEPTSPEQKEEPVSPPPESADMKAKREKQEAYEAKMKKEADLAAEVSCKLCYLGHFISIAYHILLTFFLHSSYITSYEGTK
jgi:hypothetical protein